MEVHNKAKILVVDDNPANVQVLGTLLKKLEFRIEFALNGFEALKWVQKESFDLILLDVEMPKMTGYEVCKKLKADEKTKDMPVIFVTVHDDVESTIKGFELGAVDFVSKPYNLNELRARISTQIELKRSSDAIRKYSKELERKNRIIMESITYAEHIQRNILPNKDDFHSYFSDWFIIFKPKQIIGGDFYWFKPVEELVIFSVIDCTGHGVPGAIMSMIAFTAINDAIIENKILEPERILQHIHGYLIKTLHSEKKDSIGDGMDITMCVLNTTTNELRFSSTNQKVFVVSNGELVQYDSHNWSIGEFDFHDQEFIQQKISLEIGDAVYLFSDGYKDQFSGINNKKYSIKRFREKINTIKHLPMSEQKYNLEEELAAWKGGTDQIDDITIWGIKF